MDIWYVAFIVLFFSGFILTFISLIYSLLKDSLMSKIMLDIAYTDFILAFGILIFS